MDSAKTSASLTVKEALNKVFEDINALSPEDFRAKLDKCKDSHFVLAMTEASDFLGEFLADQQRDKDAELAQPYKEMSDYK